MYSNVYVSTACLKGANSRYSDDVLDVLSVYKKMGIQSVELGAVHKFIRDMRPLFGYKKDFRFIVHSLFPPLKDRFMLNLSSGTDIRQRTLTVAKNCILLCRKLDAPLYGIHRGFLADIDGLGNAISPVIPPDKAEELLLDSLTELCDYAERYAIKIALENSASFQPHLPFYSARQFKAMLKKVGSPCLGLLIDIGHLAISAEHHDFVPREFVQEVSDYVFEFHIHDAVDGVDHKPLHDTSILSRFGITRNLAKKNIMTLEVNGLSEAELMKNIQLLKESIDLLT